MSYLEKIQRCHHVQLDAYLPFMIAGQRYGYIPTSFVNHLQQWSDIFHISHNHVTVNPELSSYQQRSDAFIPVLDALHQTGIIDTWVNELYPVNHEYGQQAVMQMERAAALYFGIRCYGVHMNGLVKKPDGIYVWIAVRAKDKPFFPGQLDQMVAGGQPVGIGLMDNLVKESQEEANIPASLASQAQARGYIHYQMETSRGIEASTLFNFDCWLPADFVPENTDGEVDSFALLPLEELAEITEQSDDFKDNCNLTNIDLLIRAGIITPQHPEYDAITQ
jgi:8-oxo-dGTP pyrophosphatase MutT (NUDIX family)